MRDPDRRNSDPNDPDELDENEQSPPSWSQRPWFWMLVILLGVFTLTNLFSDKLKIGALEVEANRLFGEVERGNVESVTEAEQEVFVAILRSKVTVDQPGIDSENSLETQKIFAVIPGELKTDLNKLGAEYTVPVTFRDNTTPGWQVLVSGIVPFIILLLFFWWMSNRLRRQMGGPGIFGKFAGNQAKKIREG